MKKGQVLEGTIEKVEFPNKGVVTVAEEGKSVIVKNGIPGQKVKFCVNKFKRGNAEGRLLEVLEKSPLETRKPVCSIFPVCGGCMYQTMSYEAQMDMKAEQVKNILNEAVNGEYLFEGVKASPKEFAYRNKMEFSFGDEYKDGPLTLGLHKKGSTYDVLTASDCKLVHDDMTKILNCVLEYFKERNVSYYKKMQHTGYLRHLLLRRGDRTGEILVNLVTTTQEEQPSPHAPSDKTDPPPHSSQPHILLPVSSPDPVPDWSLYRKCRQSCPLRNPGFSAEPLDESRLLADPGRSHPVFPQSHPAL